MNEQVCLSCELPESACNRDPRCPFVQIAARRRYPKKYPHIPHGNITRKIHLPAHLRDGPEGNAEGVEASK